MDLFIWDLNIIEREVAREEEEEKAKIQKVMLRENE